MCTRPWGGVRRPSFFLFGLMRGQRRVVNRYHHRRRIATVIVMRVCDCCSAPNSLVSQPTRSDGVARIRPADSRYKKKANNCSHQGQALDGCGGDGARSPTSKRHLWLEAMFGGDWGGVCGVFSCAGVLVPCGGVVCVVWWRRCVEMFVAQVGRFVCLPVCLSVCFQM